jgi:hypothetical protein
MAKQFSPLAMLVCGMIAAGMVLTSGCQSPDASGRPAEEASAPDSSTGTSVDTTAPADPAFPVRAVTLDARRRPEDGLLKNLRRLGATHVTLTTFAWQRRADTPRLELHTDGSWYSESDRGIRALSRKADSLDMGVILKPHIWIGGYDSDGQSRHAIGFDTEAEWEKWESDYRRFVLHYARLAAEVDAHALVVGTELTRAATSRPAFWRDLISEIRTLYDGRLTYAANWHEAYRDIPFWDALDYIGVQAYFPIADRDDPPLTDLVRGWAAHRDSLRALHERTDTPVLFTEMGYRSVAFAGREPWRWPEENPSEPPAPDVQARCYRAFFATFAPESWFAGAIVWKWHPESESRRPTGFTPQNKPAEHVLRRWFRGTG